MSNRIKIKIKRKRENPTKVTPLFLMSHDDLNDKVLTLGKIMLDAFGPVCEELRKSYIF